MSANSPIEYWASGLPDNKPEYHFPSIELVGPKDIQEKTHGRFIITIEGNSINPDSILVRMSQNGIISSLQTTMDSMMRIILVANATFEDINEHGDISAINISATDAQGRKSQVEQYINIVPQQESQ
jgi:hypothetical protein